MNDHLSATSDRRFIRCVVGDGTYCLPLSAVRAIRRKDELRPNVEGAWPAGWVEVSGRTAPVLRLASLMGVSRAPGASEAFVVLGTEDDPWALGVDRISKPFSSPSGRRERFPLVEGGAISPFFVGAALDGERLVPILAIEQLRRVSEGATTARRLVHERGGRVERAPAGAARGGADGRLLVFSSGEGDGERVLFGLSLLLVAEIRRPTAVWPVPGAIPFVFGIAEWQGRSLPVIDLGLRLGLAGNAVAAPSKLIVVRSPDGSAHAGLSARSDIGLRRLDPGTCGRSVSDWLDPVLTRAVFELEGRPLVIPDLSLLIQGSDAVESQDHISSWASAQKGALQ